MQKVRIEEDIHYGTDSGLVPRNEAIIHSFEVELVPYIRKGEYPYTITQDEVGDYVLINMGVNDDREVELIGYGPAWMTFID